MDVISELLDDGANIEVRDNDGWTPLMHAASSDNVPAIQLLIAHKAKVDATTPDGYTALAYALADGHFAAAQALVNAGASVSRAVGAGEVDAADDYRKRASAAQSYDGSRRRRECC